MTEDTPKYQVGRIEQLTETPQVEALNREKHLGTGQFQDTKIWKLARKLERENAKLRGQRDELVKLARESYAGFEDTEERFSMHQLSKEYVERRIAEILGEG